MIKIQVLSNGTDIIDDNHIDDCSPLEIGLILWRLEKIKQELLEIDFQPEEID